MTLEQKRIKHLHTLLHQVKDLDAVAALRWAIFELEQIYPA